MSARVVVVVPICESGRTEARRLPRPCSTRQKTAIGAMDAPPASQSPSGESVQQRPRAGSPFRRRERAPASWKASSDRASSPRLQQTVDSARRSLALSPFPVRASLPIRVLDPPLGGRRHSAPSIVRVSAWGLFPLFTALAFTAARSAPAPRQKDGGIAPSSSTSRVVGAMARPRPGGRVHKDRKAGRTSPPRPSARTGSRVSSPPPPRR